MLLLFLHRAPLRARCKSQRASKPVPRLQNELFLALRMLRRRECRKDSRCNVNIYEKAWKSIQARILAIVSCYVNNAFFTTHETVRIKLTFSKSCSVHFLAFGTIFIFCFCNVQHFQRLQLLKLQTDVSNYIHLHILHTVATEISSKPFNSFLFTNYFNKMKVLRKYRKSKCSTRTKDTPTEKLNQSDILLLGN